MFKTRETKYEICEGYAKVYLYGDKEYFLCDLEDLEIAKNRSWNLNGKGYAQGWDRKHKKYDRFHKLVFPIRKGYVIDHINRNRLDNRKKNLREVTVVENSNNKVNQQHLEAPCVRHIKNRNGDRYIVSIHDKEYKTRHIGVFDTLEQAISARDTAYLDIKGVPFPYI